MNWYFQKWNFCEIHMQRSMKVILIINSIHVSIYVPWEISKVFVSHGQKKEKSASLKFTLFEFLILWGQKLSSWFWEIVTKRHPKFLKGLTNDAWMFHICLRYESKTYFFLFFSMHSTMMMTILPLFEVLRTTNR